MDSHEDIEACPLCSTLAISSTPIGSEATSMVFSLAQNEGKLDAIRRWSSDTRQLDPEEGSQDGNPPSCDLCRLITDLDRHWSGLETAAPQTFPQRYSYTCSPNTLRICVDEDLWPMVKGQISRVIHPDPLSPRAFARLTRWMKLCDASHPRCQGVAYPTLPTRVLDVGSGEEMDLVILLETNGQRGEYIALSHCWGDSKPFITTTSTLGEMKAGFLPNQAPATFCDAIRLTRKLGVRYLWIDSLCIIQDDPLDWQMESSQMGDVYQNAYLTIAASRASSDSDGFLQNRPFVYNNLEVISRSGVERVKIHLLQDYRLDSVTNPEPYGRAPLELRGWTLQEAKLSRRVVSFFSARMGWKCHAFCWNEDEHESDDPRGREGWVTWVGDSIRRLYRDRHTAAHDSPGHRYESWYFMLSFSYTSRKLSYESDRLPALSGMASMVAAANGGKYCSGIWWEGIAFGLCFRRPAASRFTRPREYLAPSWSWASVVGKIDYPATYVGLPGGRYTAEHRSVTFCQFSITLKGANPYGEVQNGWIRLQAPLLPLLPLLAISRQTPAKRDSGLEEDPLGRTVGISHLAEDMQWSASVHFDFPTEEREILALFLIHIWGNDNPGEVMFSGIVVIPSEDPPIPFGEVERELHAKSHRRVGYVSLKTSGVESRDCFERLLGKTEVKDIALY